jgi:hypothetical protein
LAQPYSMSFTVLKAPFGLGPGVCVFVCVCLQALQRSSMIYRDAEIQTQELRLAETEVQRLDYEVLKDNTTYVLCVCVCARARACV